MFASSQSSDKLRSSGAFAQGSATAPPLPPLAAGLNSSMFGNSFSSGAPPLAGPGAQSQYPSATQTPSQQLQSQQQQQQLVTRPPQPLPAPAAPSRPATLDERQRAAAIVNQTLADDECYPSLDSYLAHGLSYRYDTTSGARAPFQKVKMYNIPDAVFMQLNRGTVSTSMGLFAELDHAWVIIDDALFMWNYTDPDPELVALEKQPSNINAVALAKPRPGVFLPSVTHLLVIAMTGEVAVMGLGATNNGPNGSTVLELFSTGMQVPTKGMNVDVIASTSSGRIFFTGSMDGTDVHELNYQLTERWFQGRCWKTNHTNKSLLNVLMPAFASSAASVFNPAKSAEHTVQMVVDDSRSLLYTLSSESTIRVFAIGADNALDLIISKRVHEIYTNIAHIISVNTSLTPNTKLVSINPIPLSEASRYHLSAMTATGHRIYLSATSSFPWLSAPAMGGSRAGPAATTIANSSKSSFPTTMQALHVRFPPGAVSEAAGMSGNPNFPARNTRLARRFTPGYYVAVRGLDQSSDSLLLSAPHPTRLSSIRAAAVQPAGPAAPGAAAAGPIASATAAAAPAPAPVSEVAVEIKLNSKVEDIGLRRPAATRPYPAHGNELATQFDELGAEIAVLTNSGVHIFRRRRLVDVLAAQIRQVGGDERLDGAAQTLMMEFGHAAIIGMA
ncbi:hypothetical protein KEM52_006398, partial [Ascosphaera acerosa]